MKKKQLRKEIARKQEIITILKSSISRWKGILQCELNEKRIENIEKFIYQQESLLFQTKIDITLKNRFL